MDNITHTLIGALVGDASDRLVPAGSTGLPARTRRAFGLGIMVVGSNLPDADIVYSTATGNKLDYLLQHRGHTHTVIGAVVLAALVAGCLWLWPRLRQRWSARDITYLATLALLAPLLHIALDATNSYGVHPFWPFHNDWFYGDSVFIVEPLLWSVATPLVFTLHGKLARTLVALAILAGIALAIATGLVPMPMVAGLVMLVALFALVGAKTSPRTALASGIAAWGGVTLVFLVTGVAADERFDRILAAGYPEARTLDRVLTPMPVNPVCREVFAVQVEGDRYVVRKGTLALLPGWFPADRCPQRVMGTESTAPMSAVALPSTDEIRWAGQFEMERQRLGELDRESCAARALLIFARVPWAMPVGERWIVGDLRFDREPGPGLAEIETGPMGDPCPTLMAPWTPPRADILGPIGR